MLIIINTLVLNGGKPKGTNCTTEENEFPTAFHPWTWTPVAGHMFYNFGKEPGAASVPRWNKSVRKRARSKPKMDSHN